MIAALGLVASCGTTNGDGGSSRANSVEVTIDGSTERLTFSDVYCSGPSGEIKQVTAKVDNELPLLEVVPEQGRVMLKMGEERPHETNDADGVEQGDESITLSSVSVGDAEVEGTLTCTERN